MRAFKHAWANSILFLLSVIPCFGGPGLATGIKIGEVDCHSALVWARLTVEEDSEPLLPVGSAPGSPGLVRLEYWPKNDPGTRMCLPPRAVDPQRDFTVQIPLAGLEAGTDYQVEVTALGETGEAGATILGHFRTAPLPDKPASVTGIVVTCQGHESVDDPEKGHWTYLDMLRHDPDLFIHTGDVVYYDKGAAQPLSKNVPLARERWDRMFAYQWNREAMAQVASYWMKDDHDTLKDDCWPGQVYGDLTFAQGLEIFREQTPQGELPYRTFRYGKDLQVWLLEGRDYRSPNTGPDGPEKTILGPQQKAWLKRTVKESDAAWKLVVSPGPLVGPDKKGKADNLSNDNFSHEGQELREFLASVPGLFVVCGDRHWQYASKDPATGLVEIACGPINDEHATIGGNADRDPNLHLYYGGGKGGYLLFHVERAAGEPRIRFIWHGDQSSGGAVNHELVF